MGMNSDSGPFEHHLGQDLCPPSTFEVVSTLTIHGQVGSFRHFSAFSVSNFWRHSAPHSGAISLVPSIGRGVQLPPLKECEFL